MRKTEIHPWCEEWGLLYKQEEVKLREIFKDEVVDIDHIGSTSIPTIGYAKPIIDILVTVRDIGKIDNYSEQMVQLGYHPKGENGIKGRRYFSKGGTKRTHHVHIYQKGHESIDSHLIYKKYLLKHPEIAKQYGKLKLELAKRYSENTKLYQLGKEPFLKELNEKISVWINSQK